MPRSCNGDQGQNPRVAVDEALTLATLHGAYASHQENMKGSITAGNLAALAIPERVRPVSIPHSRRRGARALAPRCVYYQILRMSNPTRTISVTEAARRFADVVNRAFYRNETTLLVKNGVPVAFIAPMAPTGVPASELGYRWPSMPRLSPADAAAFADDVAAARAALPTATEPLWE